MFYIFDVSLSFGSLNSWQKKTERIQYRQGNDGKHKACCVIRLVANLWIFFMDLMRIPYQIRLESFGTSRAPIHIRPPFTYLRNVWINLFIQICVTQNVFSIFTLDYGMHLSFMNRLAPHHPLSLFENGASTTVFGLATSSIYLAMYLS